MVELVETHDAEFIKMVIHTKGIWEWVTDDSVTEFEPPFADGLIYYLVPVVDGLAVGVLTIFKFGAVLAELHTAILPEYQGRYAKDIFAELKKWAVNKGFTWLRTYVPELNRAAYVAAKRVGFNLIGTERNAFMKNGILQDYHLFGVSLCQS